MLEELTNDIHQSPNKQKVLMELANCIASGKDILLDFCDCVPNSHIFNASISLTTEGDLVELFSLHIFLGGITKNSTT